MCHSWVSPTVFLRTGTSFPFWVVRIHNCHCGWRRNGKTWTTKEKGREDIKDQAALTVKTKSQEVARMKPPPETPTIKPIERKRHMWALKRTTAAVPHADITKVSRPSWSPRSSVKNIWGSLLPTTWPMRFAHGIHLGLLHIRKVGSMTSHHTPSSHLRGTLTLHHAHVELHTSVPKPWSTRSCEKHSVSHCSQTDMHIFKRRKKKWKPKQKPNQYPEIALSQLSQQVQMTHENFEHGNNRRQSERREVATCSCYHPEGFFRANISETVFIKPQTWLFSLKYTHFFSPCNCLKKERYFQRPVNPFTALESSWNAMKEES